MPTGGMGPSMGGQPSCVCASGGGAHGYGRELRGLSAYSGDAHRKQSAHNSVGCKSSARRQQLSHGTARRCVAMSAAEASHAAAPPQQALPPLPTSEPTQTASPPQQELPPQKPKEATQAAAPSQRRRCRLCRLGIAHGNAAASGAVGSVVGGGLKTCSRRCL